MYMKTCIGSKDFLAWMRAMNVHSFGWYSSPGPVHTVHSVCVLGTLDYDQSMCSVPLLLLLRPTGGVGVGSHLRRAP